MYILTYLYILAEISAYHLQLKCMGGHFFPGHPYIESTTVLSDKLRDIEPKAFRRSTKVIGSGISLSLAL